MTDTTLPCPYPLDPDGGCSHHHDDVCQRSVHTHDWIRALCDTDETCPGCGATRPADEPPPADPVVLTPRDVVDDDGTVVGRCLAGQLPDGMWVYVDVRTTDHAAASTSERGA